MKLIRSLFAGLALGAALLAGSPALMAAPIIQPGYSYQPTMAIRGIITADLTTPYSNSTTTPTLISSTSTPNGLLVTMPQGFGFNPAIQQVCVRWSADVTKSTASTGQIGVAINGVIDPVSYRFTSSAAGRNGINGNYCVARPSLASLTVSLWGMSGDTNPFTVNNAYFEVYTLTFQNQGINGL